MRRPPALLLLLLLGVPFLAHARTLGGGFLADDFEWLRVVHETQQRGLLETLRMLHDPDWQGGQFYRVTAHLAADFGLATFGAEPLAFRVFCLLLHGANAVLLTLLVVDLCERCRWSSRWLAGGVAGASFALFPAQAEAVAWICCCSELMAETFTLLALLCVARRDASHPNQPRQPIGAIEANDANDPSQRTHPDAPTEPSRRRRDRSTWTGLAAVAVALALASKETGIVAVPAAAALVFFRAAGSARARVWQALRGTWWGWVVVAGYLLLRLQLFGRLGGYAGQLALDPFSAPFWDSRFSLVRVLLAPVHPAFAPGWIGLPVALLLIGLLVAGVWTRARTSPAAVATGWAWLLLGFVPSVGLGVEPDTLYGSRLTYQPALALCFLLGLAIAGVTARGAARVRSAADGGGEAAASRWTVGATVTALLLTAFALLLQTNVTGYAVAGHVSRRLQEQVRALTTGPDPAVLLITDIPQRWHGAVLGQSAGSRMFRPPFFDAPPGQLVAGFLDVEREALQAQLRQLATHVPPVPARVYRCRMPDGQLVPEPAPQRGN